MVMFIVIVLISGNMFPLYRSIIDLIHAVKSTDGGNVGVEICFGSQRQKKR